MMPGRLRVWLLMVGPIVGATALALQGPTVALQRRLVDQPAHWVPFSADYRRVHEVSGSVSIGRTYQASDGSYRSESAGVDGVVTSVGIRNVPDVTFYRWTRQEGWTSQPMVLPPNGGWAPIPRLFNDRMTEVDETVEGFRLIRVDTNGRILYQAPDLNMFTLAMVVTCQFDPAAACGRWYSNIRLGEPPAEYFRPPDGVVLVPLAEPGGIIWNPPAE
jgi:hypothetical protein